MEGPPLLWLLRGRLPVFSDRPCPEGCYSQWEHCGTIRLLLLIVTGSFRHILGALRRAGRKDAGWHAIPAPSTTTGSGFSTSQSPSHSDGHCTAPRLIACGEHIPWGSPNPCAINLRNIYGGTSRRPAPRSISRDCRPSYQQLECSKPRCYCCQAYPLESLAAQRQLQRPAATREVLPRALRP